jgi:hypothetical protein
MPITEVQIADVRADIGDSNPDAQSFTDTEIQRLYTRAEEIHGAGSALVEPQVRVLAIKQLWASSAKLTTYKQNQSSENLSDVFKHLKALLELYQGELADAEAAGTGGGVAIMGLKKTPTRQKDVPGCWD